MVYSNSETGKTGKTKEPTGSATLGSKGTSGTRGTTGVTGTTPTGKSSGKSVSGSQTNANKSIECTVTDCAFHCNTANYCSLEKIKVVNNSSSGTKESDSCTDCQSYSYSG